MSQQEEQLWRANIYGLLAAVLAEPPTEDTLNMLSLLKLKGPSVSDTPLEIALHDVACLAQNLEPHIIHEEFQVLFVGITRGEVVPNGSFYLSGFMIDKSLAELRSSLAKLGYERREKVYEYEDHVAALCDVMRGLITDPEDEFKTALQKQKLFYHAHISPWFMRFFQDLTETKQANFYSRIAMLGNTFMLLENEYLAMDG